MNVQHIVVLTLVAIAVGVMFVVGAIAVWLTGDPRVFGLVALPAATAALVLHLRARMTRTGGNRASGPGEEPGVAGRSVSG